MVSWFLVQVSLVSSPSVVEKLFILCLNRFLYKTIFLSRIINATYVQFQKLMPNLRAFIFLFKRRNCEHWWWCLVPLRWSSHDAHSSFYARDSFRPRLTTADGAIVLANLQSVSTFSSKSKYALGKVIHWFIFNIKLKLHYQCIKMDYPLRPSAQPY